MDTADRLEALLEEKLKETIPASELKTLEALQAELQKLAYSPETDQYSIPPIDTIGINLKTNTTSHSLCRKENYFSLGVHRVFAFKPLATPREA